MIFPHINPAVFAGAEILGGGFSSGSRGAERAGGAAKEARAGAGREGNWHCGARAEHHHPSGVPGETQREKEERPFQEEQTTKAGPGQQLHQSALWWVPVATTGLIFKPISQVPPNWHSSQSGAPVSRNRAVCLLLEIKGADSAVLTVSCKAALCNGSFQN